MIANTYSNGIILFEGCLPDDFCSKVIDTFEDTETRKLRLSHLGTGYTKGTQYNETFLRLDNSPVLEKMLSEHVESLKNAYFELMGIEDDGVITSFNDPVIKHYSVETNDQFLMHYDSSREFVKRGLAMIWYLTDVIEGGETVFPLAEVEIKPKRGSCLLFPAFWNYPHLARKPLSNDKYTLNTFGNANTK